MIAAEENLTYKKIFVFWVPLAATWLMMSTEGPFLAAVIARLADPKYNLAAYGVAFSFAVLLEAPIIMIMSASTALVKDRDSYLKLRNFTFVANGIITFVMLLFVIPPVFYFITQNLIGLPNVVARLTHHACLILIPWPAAIGYRRFYQGILIRSDLTRRVAYGTVIRISSMIVVALIAYLFLELQGAIVGALGLACGVTAEAMASRMMAGGSVDKLLNDPPLQNGESPLSYRYITKFYYPLALTSVLALGVHPMVTFFMGQSRMPIESLAVLPVVNSLIFVFRSMGLSFQEVGIALMGVQNQNFHILRNYAIILGTTVTVILSLVTFTPLSVIWFQKISGLSMELTLFARYPAQILTLMPALSVLISFQRGIMVNGKKTTPVTMATTIEVISIITILYLTIQVFGFIGAIGAAISLMVSRLLANGYLFHACAKVLKSTNST